MIPLWPTFTFCFGWNALGFGISTIFKTEKFYDMFGTSTFALSAIFTMKRMLDSSPRPYLHLRQVLLFVNTATWALRLFVFLAYRVHLLKGDRRFDKIKGNPLRFGVAFTIQALWAAVVGLPVYTVLSLEYNEQPALGLLDVAGLGLWFFGFFFETVADIQKLNWQKKEGEARFKKFMHTGLFRYCRYPNYMGEIALWTGNYLIAVAAFPGSMNALVKLSASPLLTTFLLTGLSGIPLQEKQAKQRFADNEEYKRYVKSTSLLVPWFPGYTPAPEKKEEKKEN
ncbi:hypothetical protein HDU96_008344 [Phlyctochytrium bullatum]|nr:hypothetical protein HDU96_008344 [Phlyctochytrium bullatum]